MTVPKTVAFKPPFRQSPNAPDPITISFTFERRFAPALKSSIEDISNQVGKELEQAHVFAKEDALTYAAAALGALRQAITAQVPRGSDAYDL